jgi:hypothetical protein
MALPVGFTRGLAVCPAGSDPENSSKLRDPELCPLEPASWGNRTIPFLPGKRQPFKESTAIHDRWDYFNHNRAPGAGARWSDRRSARRARREGSSESNRTNLHEGGAASPEDFVFGLIRVDSENSWFKCSPLGHPGTAGSFAFPADQDF